MFSLLCRRHLWIWTGWPSNHPALRRVTLWPVQHEQQAAGGVESPLDGLGQQVPADGLVLGGALDDPQRRLVALGVDAEGADHGLAGEVEPVDVDDQPAPAGQVAIAELVQPCPGGGHEPRGHRRLGC
jgi:hypothetical protein